MHLSYICDHTSSRVDGGGIRRVEREREADCAGSITGAVASQIKYLSYRKICFWPSLKGAFLSA